jgi:hypothetical protein
MGPERGTAPTPLHSGWLEKRGHFNTGFKRRWFVLTDSLKLSYYEAPGESKLKGEVRPSPPIHGASWPAGGLRCLDGGLRPQAQPAPPLPTR